MEHVILLIAAAISAFSLSFLIIQHLFKEKKYQKQGAYKKGCNSYAPKTITVNNTEWVHPSNSNISSGFSISYTIPLNSTSSSHGRLGFHGTIRS